MSDGSAIAATSVTGAGLVKHITAPKSIAIVGASSDPKSQGGRPQRYLQRFGFEGPLTLINPNRDEIEGVPCLPSIAEIEPGSVELAMIALPAPMVPGAVEELAMVGVPAALSIAERMTGDQIASIRETCMRTGIRVIGPNCVGLISPSNNTFLTFSSLLQQGRPRNGSIGLVAQSGAMGNAMLVSLFRRGAGLAHWVTSGDEADVGALELIAGMLRSPEAACIGAFFEGMTDIAWLPEVERAIAETGKPVFVVKGARTAAGRSAAAGHTGRAVGSAEASLSAMREAGMRDVPDMAALVDILVMADVLDRPLGRRLGFVTISGGAGVLAADATILGEQTELAELGSDAALHGLLGGRVHEISNPLDVAGSPLPVYADWVNAVAASPPCDVAIAIHAPMLHGGDAVVDCLLPRPNDGSTLVVANFAESDPLSSEAVLRLADAGVPVMASAERAVAAIDLILASRVSGRRGEEIKGRDEPGDLLGFEDSIARLGDALPWVEYAIVTSPEEARARAETLGYPLVVKVAGRTIHHRTEAHGAIVGVTADGLDEAYAEIAEIAGPAGDVVMLQRQAQGGVEVMVSGLLDRELGPIVIVRPGGVLTELLSEQAILWSGWERERHQKTIRDSIVGQLLLGYRGGEVYDLPALVDVAEGVLVALGEGRIAFVEFNPVIVCTEGVAIVDALAKASNDSQEVTS